MAQDPQYSPEREVRFAVVMYGGVSLAIYIHGVARELLSLVRATAPREPAPENQDGSALLVPEEELTGAEGAYRKLAQMLDERGRLSGERLRAEGWDLEQDPLEVKVPDPAPPVRTRFVVDVLSGTSAGGINAIYLAKALANNQSLDHLSSMWKKHGDLDVLLHDAGSKVENLLPDKTPAALLNSRRMYFQLLDALQQMTPPERRRAGEAGETRSPLVEELDLHITATDLEGLTVPIRLADRVVRERRHRGVFRFHYASPYASGATRVSNDFHQKNDPFLAFAARATSAFPVAFEPMTLAEARSVMKNHRRFRGYQVGQEGWARFYKHFDDPDFSNRAFGDGGYLDNKPFSYVTETLARRRADLPVDRKLIYIEPAPETLEESAEHKKPDALQNAMAAALVLPRYETIREDLERLQERNRALDRLEKILRRAVKEAAAGHGQSRTYMKLDPGSSARSWSRKDLDEMRQEYGSSYVLYHQLRVSGVLDNLAQLVARISGLDEGSDAVAALRHLLEAWRERHFYRDRSELRKRVARLAPDQVKPRRTENALLYAFDLTWRLRRLRFVRQQVRLLRHVDDPDTLEFIRNTLGVVAQELHDLLKDSQAELTPELRSEIKTRRQDLDDHHKIVGRLQGPRQREYFRDALIGALSPALNQQLVELRAFGRALRHRPATAGLHPLFGAAKRRLLQHWSEAAEDEPLPGELAARVTEDSTPELWGRWADVLKEQLEDEPDRQRAIEQFAAHARYAAAADRLTRHWQATKAPPRATGGEAEQSPLPPELTEILQRPRGLQLERAREILEREGSELGPALDRLLDALERLLAGVMKQASANVRYVVSSGARASRSRPSTAWAKRYGKRLRGRRVGRARALARDLCATLYDSYERYDMVSLPLTSQTNLAEADVVEVLRLSPRDATSLVDENELTATPKLAGTALGNFGAFLVPGWRENDMLWGRLDAAERLIHGLLSDDVLREDGDEKTSDNRRLRDALVFEAQVGILAQEQRAAKAAGWRPQDLAGQKRLRDDFVDRQARGRSLPPQSTLQLSARASRVMGKLIDGLAESYNMQGKGTAWLVKLTQIFWGLVTVAIPDSIASKLANHLLQMLYFSLIVLVAIGAFFRQGVLVKWGLAAAAVGISLQLAVFVLGKFMKGMPSRRLRRFLGTTAVASVIGIGYLAWVGALALWPRVLATWQAFRSLLGSVL